MLNNTLVAVAALAALLAAPVLASDALAQTEPQTLFTDDFESGLGKWVETTGSFDPYELYEQEDYELWWRHHRADDGSLSIPYGDRWGTARVEQHDDDPPVPRLVGNGPTNTLLHVDACDTNCVITLADTIDLTAYSSATLTFDRFVDAKLDYQDYLQVEVSKVETVEDAEVRSWERLHKWHQGPGTESRGDSGVWEAETVDLADYLEDDEFSLRFVARATQASEDILVDNVTITGVPGDAPGTPGAADDAETVLWTAGATGIDVLGNDGGTSKSVTTFTGTGTHGTLVRTSGTVLTYTPGGTSIGTDTFTISVDLDGTADTSELAIHVTYPGGTATDHDGDGAGNDTDMCLAAHGTDADLTDSDTNDGGASDTDPADGCPDIRAVADAGQTVTKNDNATLDPLDNDHGHGLTVTASSFTYSPAATGGSVDPATGAGPFAFVPPVDYVGEVTFTFEISDSTGDTAMSTLAVTYGDTDSDGDTVPDEMDACPNVHRNDGDTTDGDPNDAMAVDESPVDGCPDVDAVDEDPVTQEKNTPVTFDPLANDLGHQLTVTGITFAYDDSFFDEGTLDATTGTGPFTFTPEEDFVGVATLTVTIRDGQEITDTSTLAVTYTDTDTDMDGVYDEEDACPNTPPGNAGNVDSSGCLVPAVVNDAEAIESGPSAVLEIMPLEDDTGENKLIPSFVPPAGQCGTLEYTNDQTLTYTPTEGQACTESFTFNVSLSGQNLPTTLTITVTAPAAAPVAEPDTATITSDALSNASVEISPLTNDTGDNGSIPNFGEIAGDCGALEWASDTSVRYVADAGAACDESFTFNVMLSGQTVQSMLTVTVTAPAPAPEAGDDTATILRTAGATVIDDILDNDDGDSKTIPEQMFEAGSHGTLARTSDAELTYTPEGTTVGEDTFTVTVDLDGTTDTSGLAVHVINTGGSETDHDADSVANGSDLCLQSAPDAVVNAHGCLVPAAVDDPETTDRQTQHVFHPLENDTGENKSIPPFDDRNGDHGTLSRLSATELSYLPTRTSVGEDTFTITISLSGETLTSQVVVTVTDTDDDGDGVLDLADRCPFVAAETDMDSDGCTDAVINDEPAASTEQGTAVQLDPLANDMGTELSVTGITFTPTGAGSLDGTSGLGPFTFTPADDFTGEVTFTFTISDGPEITDLSSTQTLTVTEPVPDAADDEAEVDTDASVDIKPLDNDTGANPTLRDAGYPRTGSFGTLSYVDSTTLRYTADDTAGEDVFNDIPVTLGGTDLTSTLTVTVSAPAADGPARDDTFTLLQDSSARTLDVLANDVGTAKSIQSSPNPSPLGNNIIRLSNQLLYIPSMPGTDEFEISVRLDGTTYTSMVTVVVTPTASGSPPQDLSDRTFGIEHGAQDLSPGAFTQPGAHAGESGTGGTSATDNGGSILQEAELVRSGSSNDHLRAPTFGTSLLTGERQVECGYSMDGACRDVEAYHVEYEREIIETGSTHDFSLKAHGADDIEWFQIGFGVPEIGSATEEAEAMIHVEVSPDYTTDAGYRVDRVEYRNHNSVIGEDATFEAYLDRCAAGDAERDCVTLEINSVLFREQMYAEPFVIFVMDENRRTATHYMNDGLLVRGDSLNPIPEHTMTERATSQGAAESIMLQRTDKLADIWEDGSGHVFTRNDSGTWILLESPAADMSSACTDADSRMCDAFADKLAAYNGSLERLRDSLFDGVYSAEFDDLTEAVSIYDIDGDSRTAFLESSGMMWLRN